MSSYDTHREELSNDYWPNGRCHDRPTDRSFPILYDHQSLELGGIWGFRSGYNKYLQHLSGGRLGIQLAR